MQFCYRGVIFNYILVLFVCKLWQIHILSCITNYLYYIFLLLLSCRQCFLFFKCMYKYTSSRYNKGWNRKLVNKLEDVWSAIQAQEILKQLFSIVMLIYFANRDKDSERTSVGFQSNQNVLNTKCCRG